MTPRERLLCALNCEKPDYVPCSFMLFRALRLRARDDYDYIEKAVELGLDTFAWLPVNNMNRFSDFMDLNGLPNRIHPDVQIKNWVEIDPNESVPILHKEYITPGGILKTEVRKTEDWPYYYHIPVCDDYLASHRSRKYLIESKEDLRKLRYILTEPTKEDIAQFRQDAKEMKKIADKHNLPVAGMWGVGLDSAAWLCGLENIMMLSYDDPGFVEEYVDVIGRWNRSRMQVHLDFGVDLFVRRGWYEGRDFWGPEFFRKLILPSLKKEVDLAHQAGAKFGHIITSKAPVDELIEIGVDVLIGVDPVMDPTMDLAALKAKAKGKICLWGGVNQALTVEQGSENEIKEAVEKAVRTLGKDGGFILCPVENVIDVSQEVWDKELMFIEAWKELRAIV